MAQRFRQPPVNNEFVGMSDYIEESIHVLLKNNSESISNFASSQGSYHPSCECFMANIIDNPHREATLEGHITSVNNHTLHGGMRLPRILPMGTGLWRVQRSRPTCV
jgi:hypothetical protein